MKNVLKLIGIYALIYIIYSLIFVALFHTPLLKGMEVLMYRGIVFIILTGILSAVTMAVVRHFWKYVSIRDIIMIFVIFCCVNMVLFTLIPVTVERSVSVFMLSYMDENSERSFTEDDVQQIFTDKYVKDYGAFEKRFEEQIATGTLKDNGDGTYSITPAGKKIVSMFRMVADWFNTDKRLVYPNEN